jgi:hypothetical protein
MADNKPRDKRISLAPLSTEEALRGLMQAGPHPKDADGKPSRPKRDAASGTATEPRRPRRRERPRPESGQAP